MRIDPHSLARSIATNGPETVVMQTLRRPPRADEMARTLRAPGVRVEVGSAPVYPSGVTPASARKPASRKRGAAKKTAKKAAAKTASGKRRSGGRFLVQWTIPIGGGATFTHTYETRGKSANAVARAALAVLPDGARASAELVPRASRKRAT
jgi:hypothetical protein